MTEQEKLVADTAKQLELLEREVVERLRQMRADLARLAGLRDDGRS